MNQGSEPKEKSQIPIRDKRKLRETEPADEATPADAPAGSGEPALEARSEQSEQVDELEQTRNEAKGYLEDLQRLKADFENYRKRVIKEQTALVENAAVNLVARMLGVLDNFELAVAAAEETRDFERMLKGVEMVFGELKEVLRGEGLVMIDAKGKTFDPELHEAALEVPGDDSGRMVVSEVLRPGYLFNGRVLRPAMVKVTQQKDSKANGDDES